MTLEQYARKINLFDKLEIDKVLYFAYYYFTLEELVEFSSDNVQEWFDTLNIGQPNKSRLIKNITSSNYFIKGSAKNFYKINGKLLEKLREELPFINDDSEDIVFTSSILPESLFKDSRGYIERFSKQINASYDHKLYDACAVLMRRLVEILLIHSYEILSIENQIKKTSGDYKELKYIIADAQKNSTISLSKSSKSCIDKFRLLGNFSAHKLMYNCRKDDISNIALDFRTTVEELMYKAGLRK